MVLNTKIKICFVLATSVQLNPFPSNPAGQSPQAAPLSVSVQLTSGKHGKIHGQKYDYIKIYQFKNFKKYCSPGILSLHAMRLSMHVTPSPAGR